MTEQRRPDGSLRHLITLEGLTRPEIEALLDRAQHYVCEVGAQPRSNRRLAGITIGNLFTEPSTRTRVSFELAGRRLGAEVVNLHTLQSLHFDLFVIRDSQPGVVAHVAANVAPHVSVLSAGEAHVSHPTQGLLDALTVRQRKGDRFEKLCIAVVGDIRHSRVARSAYEAFRGLGVGELRLIAPEGLMPESGEFSGGVRFSSPEKGLKDVDVVMMLRIQKERMEAAAIPDGTEYYSRYGLTVPRLRLAKPDAIVMHPQPMNRGIEIDSEVADGAQSVIRDQVRNGVAVRMAVLECVARPRPVMS
jgi:aspartate carbamoyltransferase catalytic subunit